MNKRNFLSWLTNTAAAGAAAAILSFASNADATVVGYVVQNDVLYKVNNGAQHTLTAMTNEWGTPTSMAYRGFSNWIHIITGDQLWKASAIDGAWQFIDTNTTWPGATNMEWNVSTGKLYIVQGSALHRMDDADNSGSWSVLGGANWSGTTAMTSLGNRLYIIRDSTLYRVDPLSGSRTQIGSAVWSGTNEMTKQIFGGTDTGNLYAVQGDNLYKINPTTGARTIYIPEGGWTGTTSMFCHNNTIFGSQLYAIQANELWRVKSGQFFETNLVISGPTVAAGTQCSY